MINWLYYDIGAGGHNKLPTGYYLGDLVSGISRGVDTCTYRYNHKVGVVLKIWNMMRHYMILDLYGFCAGFGILFNILRIIY